MVSLLYLRETTHEARHFLKSNISRPLLLGKWTNLFCSWKYSPQQSFRFWFSRFMLDSSTILSTFVNTYFQNVLSWGMKYPISSLGSHSFLYIFQSDPYIWKTFSRKLLRNVHTWFLIDLMGETAFPIHPKSFNATRSTILNQNFAYPSFLVSYINK